MTQVQKNLLITVVVIVIIGVGLLVWRKESEHASVGESATSTAATSTGVSIETTGSATIKEVSSGVPAPSYSKPLVFSSSTSVDVRAALQSQFAQVQAILKKDPTNFNGWVQLGIVRKSGGDYAGAAEDWRYAAALYPSSTVPHDDLGDLYMNFVKNYPQAESQYLASISINPHDLNTYRALFSLYTDFGYKADTSAAVNILERGIRNNPDAIDLYVSLARYYVSHKDITDAKTAYAEAIATAQRLGNTQLVSSLQQELSDLH